MLEPSGPFHINYKANLIDIIFDGFLAIYYLSMEKQRLSNSFTRGCTRNENIFSHLLFFVQMHPNTECFICE